jgi:hypothetical protein
MICNSIIMGYKKENMKIREVRSAIEIIRDAFKAALIIMQIIIPDTSDLNE